MKPRLLLPIAILIVALVVLGISCTQTAPAPAPKPSPSPTPAPAPAPAPSPKPSPSPTPAPAPAPSPTTIALGGKLYDNWMKTAQVATPKENAPLWATQTTNTRTGADTWRCKECHGWDYKGKDGAYAKGSHATGFPGVYSAATTKTAAELTAILKGSPNSKHNFSTYLKDEQIAALAAFLKAGAVIDEAQYIDYTTKKPKSADAVKGKQLYGSNCAACHGVDGKMLNFGSTDKPEYVGTVAADNPWETLHKIRFGQPGAPMPSGIEMQWSIQDMLDMLAHSQTLPVK
ncbi:MAG: c-type cytochrome [Chloroflexi bacterium]|nr:c-type cytochrome [Chloroflexota bacterium]